MMKSLFSRLMPKIRHFEIGASQLVAMDKRMFYSRTVFSYVFLIKKISQKANRIAFCVYIIHFDFNGLQYFLKEKNQEKARRPITVPVLKKMKTAGEKIVALTAYDASMAFFIERSGVDIVIVGDSLGMVIQGLLKELFV